MPDLACFKCLECSRLIKIYELQRRFCSAKKSFRRPRHSQNRQNETPTQLRFHPKIGSEKFCLHHGTYKSTLEVQLSVVPPERPFHTDFLSYRERWDMCVCVGKGGGSVWRGHDVGLVG